MANLLKLRLGVSNHHPALQPNLNDCLEVMLGQADLLMTDVLDGLLAAASPAGPRRVAMFQKPAFQQAVRALAADSKVVCATYKSELTRIVYEGGGKDQAQTELLRFEDLQLFGDAELDQSIEVARAQQEVSLSVDDVLPLLDSLMSTLLGWRTIQPGLNPLRPDVFVRALQACLAEHVPEAAVRESLITPAAGLLGANLRKLYRELSDWLRSNGVEPAVPVGAKGLKGSVGGPVVPESVAKALLTLDRLRRLLAGDFDTPKANDYLHTVPASFVALQDLKQVDILVQRLEQRPRAGEAEAGADAGIIPAPAAQVAAHEEAPTARLGHQLGQEVVRLMFDNLSHDARLMPEFKRQLKAMEPAVFTLARHDSRFFSDRTHPARQFLERVTQRSLAFSSDSDEGWRRFLGTVQDAVRWLDSKVVDADIFGELLDNLQAQWTEHDHASRLRREEAARALLHAEQRNLLAQKLAADFGQAVAGLAVPGFVSEFLKGSWAHVVAEAQLSCADGSDDPYGYRALVDDLVWSVQKSTALRGRARRLAQMVPQLMERVRQGLDGIDYPPELSDRFLAQLSALHQAALEESLEEAAAAAAAPPAPAAVDVDVDSPAPGPWLGGREATESGYVDGDSFMPPDDADEFTGAPPPAEPAVGAGGLRTGTWVELMVSGEWRRVQLTWASPHATLFMFTSLSGTAHSMSRRTMERLLTQGLLKVVAGRNVVEEALDQVANAALRNSLDHKP
jgi:hypothetical protein